MTNFFSCNRCGGLYIQPTEHVCDARDLAERMKEHRERIEALEKVVVDLRVRLERVDQQSDPRFLAGDPRDAGYRR